MTAKTLFMLALPGCSGLLMAGLCIYYLATGASVMAAISAASAAINVCCFYFNWQIRA